ncbi:hypothetical protein [Desulfocurvus sp. DL9XJH121]
MKRAIAMRATARLVLASMLLSLVVGCQPTQPLPQPRKVVDPAEVAGSVQEPRWDIGAINYEHFGQGMDYTEAGLEPVFLVLKNKSLQSPVVRVEEARGVAADGEYLPYSLDEATRLVFASETFKTTTANAAKTGAVGAVLGAGLGALVGFIGGGDNIWKGAAVGAAGGALLGGAAGTYASSERDLKNAIRRELADYQWTDEAVPADYTKVGYIYFPADRGIEKVKLVLRVDGQIMRYTVTSAHVDKDAK